MKCLVTGAAGFIGSHLCERLLQLGHAVAGIDAFIPYYPRTVKEANLAEARRHPDFALHAADLRDAELGPMLEGVEAVFHLAAMPGLPRSWTDFALYEGCNVAGTQRLLEAVHVRPDCGGSSTPPRRRSTAASAPATRRCRPGRRRPTA